MTDEPFDGEDTWHVERTLRDGRVVTFRPLRPADRDELKREFDKLPPDSRYSRFMGAVSMTDALLDYLTQVDQQRHVAIGAALGAQGVGIGRFIRNDAPSTVAELAITVVPSMRGFDLGAMLYHELRRAAKLRGVSHFRAEVLANNVPMRRLLTRVGAQLVNERSEVGALVYVAAL